MSTDQPFRSGAIADPSLAKPDFPKQEQAFPGLASRMDPCPTMARPAIAAAAACRASAP
ncbi:hypothetical protein ACFSYD_16045 [Paracoccus aerius]